MQKSNYNIIDVTENKNGVYESNGCIKQVQHNSNVDQEKKPQDETEAFYTSQTTNAKEFSAHMLKQANQQFVDLMSREFSQAHKMMFENLTSSLDSSTKPTSYKTTNSD